MDSNPNDVVTILLVNSDDATAEEFNTEFEAANITSYGYQPPSVTTALGTWPTLQEMISNNTRLVTFVADLDPSTNTVAPYLLDEFTFVFENPYNVTSLSNFSCVADRPPAVFEQTATAISSGRLPLMNHFLDTSEGLGIDIPDTADINITNGISGVGSLGAAASSCSAAYGKAPAFLLVDFFDEGSAISVVNSLNGISTTAVGQTQPAVTTTSSSDASSLSNLGLASYGWLGILFVAWLVHQI